MYNAKYKAKKIEYDNIKFASQLECNVYKKMKELNIQFLTQVPFELQEKFRFNGAMIHNIKYVADYVIKGNDNTFFIIETKGMETDVFKIKRKLFIKKYGYDLVIIKSVKAFMEWYKLNESKISK